MVSPASFQSLVRLASSPLSGDPVPSDKQDSSAPLPPRWDISIPFLSATPLPFWEEERPGPVITDLLDKKTSGGSVRGKPDSDRSKRNNTPQVMVVTTAGTPNA